MRLRFQFGALVAMIAVAMSACSTRRKDTIEFFTRYSGVEICSSADVTTVYEMTRGGFSGWDIVYEVDLRMDEKCHRDLRQRLYEMSNNKPDCIHEPRCTFTADPDIIYTVENRGDRTRFVYTD